MTHSISAMGVGSDLRLRRGGAWYRVSSCSVWIPRSSAAAKRWVSTRPVANASDPARCRFSIGIP